MGKQNRITKTEALFIAYEVCLLMADTLNNVIASDEDLATKTDKEYFKKSSDYMKWYEKTILKRVDIVNEKK